MGTKRFESVTDCCQKGADVGVQCRRCGHQACLNPMDLTMKLAKLRRPPLNSLFHTVSGRMRCSKCGASRPMVDAFGSRGPR